MLAEEGNGAGPLAAFLADHLAHGLSSLLNSTLATGLVAREVLIEPIGDFLHGLAGEGSPAVAGPFLDDQPGAHTRLLESFEHALRLLKRDERVVVAMKKKGRGRVGIHVSNGRYLARDLAQPVL